MVDEESQVRTVLRFLAAIIWKHRDRHPNMAVEIKTTEFDEMMRAFGENEVVVSITRKADAVVLQLIDKTSGQALGLENLMADDSPTAQRMAAALAAFKRAPKLADELALGIGAMPGGYGVLAAEAVDILRKLSWEARA